MKLFILHSIWKNIYIDESNMKKIIHDFSLCINWISVWCIHWYFWEIKSEDFLIILPVLNGNIGKYFFYNSLEIGIWEQYIFWKNIFNFEYDEKAILENAQNIENIKREWDSNNLITYSKRKEFAWIISDANYHVGWFLIKTFFLLEEMISNKNDLQKIIQDPNWLTEFQSQAILLDMIAFEKLSLIKTRFDMLDLQLKNYSEMLYTYFTSYWK